MQLLPFGTGRNVDVINDLDVAALDSELVQQRFHSARKIFFPHCYKHLKTGLQMKHLEFTWKNVNILIYYKLAFVLLSCALNNECKRMTDFF